MTWVIFAPSKCRKRTKIGNMCVSRRSDLILINIQLQNPSQEPPAPVKAPNKDLKDRMFFET